MAMNIQGMPRGLNKSWKLKELNQLMEDRDAVVLLETGVNTENNTQQINRNFRVERQNRMDKKDKNNQYKHVGAGTAIMMRDGLNSQKITDRLNT